MVKQSQQERGFTIVELLIVIVVIGILAAITIVAYSGITSRANNTKIQGNAANIQKVAEAYNAENGRYPATTTELEAGSASTAVPSGLDVIVGSAGTAGAFTTDVLTGLTTAAKQVTVAYSCLTTCTNSTGGRIAYWDFVTNARSTTVIYVGAASAAGTFVAPAS